MAQVVPFPLARRAHFIDRQACRAADLNQDASERYIQHQLKIQRDSMRRKGIEDDLIAAELKCMESAVRAALWRAVITPGAV